MLFFPQVKKRTPKNTAVWSQLSGGKIHSLPLWVWQSPLTPTLSHQHRNIYYTRGLCKCFPSIVSLMMLSSHHAIKVIIHQSLPNYYYKWFIFLSSIGSFHKLIKLQFSFTKILIGLQNIILFSHNLIFFSFNLFIKVSSFFHHI